MLKRYQIDAYKRDYPQGTRVELGSMDGEMDMPGGLQGTVKSTSKGTMAERWQSAPRSTRSESCPVRAKTPQ